MFRFPLFLPGGRKTAHQTPNEVQTSRKQSPGRGASWAMWLSPNCTRSCKVAVFGSYHSICWLAFWHCSYWITPVCQLAFIRTPVIPVNSLVHQAGLRGYHFCSLSLVPSLGQTDICSCLPTESRAQVACLRLQSRKQKW